MFHKVMWQHMQRVVGPVLTTLLQIYWENLPVRILKIGQHLIELWP